MAAADLEYDPLANNTNNQFTGEILPVNADVDRSVWPENYPFFINDGYFKVEGRSGDTGAWTLIQESVDFHFSPQFSEYSVATGREVVSYIVLNTTDYTQVRFSYKALGKYTDTVLLSEIAGLSASNRLNRASVVSWKQVKGSPVNYHPLVRDPNVVDRSYEEITYLGLERILNAIQNPNSSTVILPKDINQIYLALANKPSLDEVKALISGATGPSIIAVADTAVEIYRFSGAATAVTGVLHITATGGTGVNCINFTTHRADNSGPWLINKGTSVNTNASIIPTLTVQLSGSEYVISAKCTGAVTYKFKLVSEFEGVN